MKQTIVLMISFLSFAASADFSKAGPNRDEFFRLKVEFERAETPVLSMNTELWEGQCASESSFQRAGAPNLYNSYFTEESMGRFDFVVAVHPKSSRGEFFAWMYFFPDNAKSFEIEDMNPQEMNLQFVGKSYVSETKNVECFVGKDYVGQDQIAGSHCVMKQSTHLRSNPDGTLIVKVVSVEMTKEKVLGTGTLYCSNLKRRETCLNNKTRGQNCSESKTPQG